MDYHERQVFAGPPETTRDFIVAAARALSRGNWRKTTRLLLNMPAWELLDSKDRVKKMLAEQIQEVGLKTYLFTYCLSFDTISVSMLSEVRSNFCCCWVWWIIVLLHFLFWFWIFFFLVMLENI